MTPFIDECRWHRAICSIHVLPGMLSYALITFFNMSNGENQVAVSHENTCVLSGTNVSCWGSGMLANQPSNPERVSIMIFSCCLVVCKLVETENLVILKMKSRSTSMSDDSFNSLPHCLLMN